ncbi:MAG: methyltransferase domain-containing protein [Hoeflea sp.]|uniref:methyltransferase domain-containing protein n=1 Tax=Hoeflea sp. TaxID=1940281 RepID=UPI001DB71074|nr:methyltransferase domain-containing protein [Hoeflea sp.]MBV1722901.1 methyltransferase domain-containing protein [Hoeflea sp.]MBV1762812.1 methyltransferase domain-containing protein [Hoeflea sp.]MBV1781509.1 methyltransferase domain-containing protein [Hoeflea sp.]
MTAWLHELRLQAVLDVIRDRAPRSVLDLGCGDGDLLVRIVGDIAIDRVVGVDLCERSLARLRTRLDAARGHGSTVELLCGSLLDVPSRFSGFDCAVLVETIEHLDADHLGAFERSVFQRVRPATVVVTTPNAEFNDLLGVPRHRFRHPDHRFEWDRARFQRWAGGVAKRQGYAVSCSDIAGRHPRLGGASQMAVFDLPGMNQPMTQHDKVA